MQLTRSLFQLLSLSRGNVNRLQPSTSALIQYTRPQQSSARVFGLDSIFPLHQLAHPTILHHKPCGSLCFSSLVGQDPTKTTAVTAARQQASQLLVPTYDRYDLELQAEENRLRNSSEIKIAVKAYHLGTDINVKDLAKEHPTAQRLSSHDHLILWTPDLNESTVIVDPNKDTVTLPRRCLVVYNFGSVVFFGLGADDQRLWIDNIRKHVGDAVEKSKIKTEETVILVHPAQAKWFEKGPDVFRVRGLDIATTRVMSSVLGQSVALETYISKVDAALASTVDILESMARSGSSRHMESLALFRLLAQNNLLYTTVITKLGVLDYSPIAWRKDRYFQVWNELMEEYEIAHRVDSLERKLVPIQENVKFILQVQHTKKTERSEVAIIVLIAVEIVLTIIHIWLDKFV